MERKKVIYHNYYKLTIVSILISIFCCLLAFSLKHITEFFEYSIFNFIKKSNALLFIILPSVGITIIYFLRKYAFQNRKNKGITEIYKTLDHRKDHLAFFKIPSHYLNGFFTVIFGGSTGVEVSTVVATAAVGNVAYKTEFSAKMYKRELICAGVTAGVAILFASPLAGWLFAMEVIARKVRKSLFISCTISAFIAWIFILLFDNKPILSFTVYDWQWSALPFFAVLSLFCGLLSVYFTLLVIHVKNFFAKITNNFLRVNIGAVLVGTILFVFPYLYGDSYHGLSEALHQVTYAPSLSFGVLILLILLKPIASSLTLGAGGDGGVFAPSIVSGAFLGILFALFCNQYLGSDLIIINSALIGAAATLSSSIYAPFTSLILVCNIVPNGYILFVPLLMASLISKYFSKIILPYNVYTYGLKNIAKQ